MTEPIRILSWNLERAATMRRREAQTKRLADLSYDIAVLTETRLGVGHGADVLAPPTPPPGRFAPEERKVVVWSRWGWISAEPAPSGIAADRWVAGVTPTPAGPLRVIGVCVPYRFLWVTHRPDGVDKRRLWEEHLAFLAALPDAIHPAALPQVLAGDFNQRIPPVAGLDPRAAARARETVMRGHAVLTEGLAGSDGRALLCHVASTVASAASATVVDRYDADGNELSDHHGAIVTIRL